MSPGSQRRAGSSDWSPLASLVAVILVGLFVYRWWNKPLPVAKPPISPVVPQLASLAPRHPPISLGGTYRGVRIGGTFDDNSNVGIDVGVGSGPFGAGVTVIRISLKDGSVAFVPDDPNISLEVANRTLTWSQTDGFGKQIGLTAPLTGRLMFDVHADLATSSALGRGELTLKGDSWSFQSSNPVGGLSSISGKDLGVSWDLSKSRAAQMTLAPRHVLQMGDSGLYIPSKGYVWHDGTTLPRLHGRDLDVEWSPGQPSLFPLHLHAATVEGQWEPDAGYLWSDQTAAPKTTAGFLAMSVQWTPGRPSPSYANVVSSVNEGNWTPAPGYTWASNEMNDLSVIPLSPQ